jgi:hypothetical protein
MKKVGSEKNFRRASRIAFRSSSERISSSMASAIGSHESALCDEIEGLKSICETSTFSRYVSSISKSEAFARIPHLRTIFTLSGRLIYERSVQLSAATGAESLLRSVSVFLRESA